MVQIMGVKVKRGERRGARQKERVERKVMNATYIGGQYVTVRGYGRLWAVVVIKGGHRQVQVDGKPRRLLTVHDGFSPVTGAARTTYILAPEFLAAT